MTTQNPDRSKRHPMTPVLIEGERYHHGSETPIQVRLGVPAPDPLPGGDYYCPIEVLSPKTDLYEWQTAAFGVNALQAVENAYAYLNLRWPMSPPVADQNEK